MGIEVTVGKSDTDTEYSSAVAIQKMMKSIILVSLAVLALSSATTISIENGQVCGLNVEACSTKPVPSAGEIELIRESWPFIKKNKNVLAEFVLEHFRVHPKTQELLPELAGIALADLPNNAYFVQLSETYVVLATNEIVDNLDNAGVLSKLLECLHPEWYVDYVSIDRQNDETLRIWYKVLEEQMGNELRFHLLEDETQSVTHQLRSVRQRCPTGPQILRRPQRQHCHRQQGSLEDVHSAPRSPETGARFGRSSSQQARRKRRFPGSRLLQLRRGHLHRHQLGSRRYLDPHLGPANQTRAVRRLHRPHLPIGRDRPRDLERHQRDGSSR